MAADLPLVLLERHHVGHHLAGVREPGQPVDHRHGGVARKLHQRPVIENADHNRIDIARKNARGIRDGLSAAELHFLSGEHDDIAAKLAHRDIKRHARARRGLVEDHRQRLAGERLVRGRAIALDALLHGAALLDHPAQLGDRNFRQIKKVPQRRSAHPAAPAFTGSCSRTRRVQARSSMPIASPTSASVTISGGTRRTTFSPAPTASRCSPRSASTSGPFGAAERGPRNTPSPPTSAMMLGKRSLISASRCLNKRPMRFTRSRKPGASITSRVALPAAIASGLPPKVEPCVPAVIPWPASLVVRNAPTGKPPPSALATAMMSGATPVR